ncbi:MAG: capsular polysaccharide biosynthesis protein [Burkholderiales bacterium]|nr:capsular polysaccharide biosynthesis protein [Burkholderiales bacterium]
MGDESRPSLAVPTRGVARIATLAALFDDHALCDRPRGDTRAVLAWGRKPSAARAERLARAQGLPLWWVEDAFLRSIDAGSAAPPLGVVVDDEGIYYDAAVPSRLERLVADPALDEAARARAESLQAAWVQGRVSKYNAARELAAPCAGPWVLAVDQTAGDASIGFGRAGPTDFVQMLEAALDEHPGLPVLLKLHPEVVQGRKRGHFGAGLTPGQAARVTVVAADAHAPSLLEPAAAVYAVTSQVGFEGLLWGKPVRCFGMPFYAGWGLTQDAQAPPQRRHPVPLWRLVHAALAGYARYVDPETGRRCEPERLIEWLALQRRMRERFAPEVVAVGFSRWKKPIVRAYFGGSQVRFLRGGRTLAAGQTVALWGRRPLPPLAGPPAAVVRLEDGFLRSVGLGAELARPLSWVMDDLGIHYDAGAPSRLEQLLAEAEFDDALRSRARALRERIVALGVTKYNVGSGDWQRLPDARRVLLVPGQVETDASIAYGATDLRSNIGLLQAVRRAHPDACVVYKPHPDVVARLRRRGRGEEVAARHCDAVVVDVPMHRLLSQVDEVHVLTSLAGFEALLRGLRVVTYGLPFYAGWGLTEDHALCARRHRRRTLDELVAAALILYPTYLSRASGAFTTPERAVEELAQWQASGASPGLPAWRRLRRMLLSVTRRN